MVATRRFLAAGVFALALPAAVAAQDIRYTETSKVEAFMSLPGMGAPIHSTTSVAGGRVRTDTDDQSTIMDYVDGRMTEIDHKAKTYWSLTFAEMMANAEAMMANAKAEMANAQQEAQAERQQAQQQEVKLDFDLKVDRLGDGGMVAGYPTQHVLVVLQAKATSETPDPETGDEVSGTMVFATDMWVSKEFPGYQALQDAQMQAAKDLSPEMRKQMEQTAESSRDMMAGMQGIQGGGDGMQKMAEEMQKIDGTPLRSLTYQIMLPEGVEFDRDAVLAMADKPIPSFSLGAAMKQGVKEGVKNAISGGLGGLLGRKKEEPKPAEQAEPAQAILMRFTTTVEDVSTAALPESTFRPDASYKEVQPAWLKTGG
jgi:hypothetical protein